MTNLTDLSPEILHNLLCFADPISLSNLSQACHQLRDFINRDDLLWKRVYLSRFDEPRRQLPSWKNALQDLVRLEKIFNSGDHDLKRSETPFLAAQILPLLLSTNSNNPTRNISFLGDHFHHSSRRSNAATVLRQSSLFRRCGLPYDEPASSIYARQLSARLHVYSSLSLEMRPTELMDIPGAVEIHPFARSRVYDLRRYRASNFWGPFMDDGSGRVDWEKVESIYVVLGYSLRVINERSGRNMFPNFGLGSTENMWCGLGTNSYNSVKAQERGREEDTRSNAATVGSLADDGDENEDPANPPPFEDFLLQYQDSREARFQHEQAVFAVQDPYGVRGKWMRIVNFLDYRDLFAFNFNGQAPPDETERDPVTTAEAFRLILLALWVTKIEWPDEDEGQPEDWETVDGSPEASPEQAVACSNGQNSGTGTDDWTNVPSPLSESSFTRSTHFDREVTKDIEANLSSITPQSITTPTTPSNPTPAKSTTGKQKEADTSKSAKKKSKYPIVHFEGRSRSLHIRWDPNANSHIRGSNPFYSITGYVRAYPSPPAPAQEYTSSASDPSPAPPSNFKPSHDGAGPNPDDVVVRWTTFSVFHGEERWRSEGVQIGGLKSARGILGNWFDKDYDPDGPAGPTGFWKLDDSVEKFGKGGQRAGGWDEEDDDDDDDDGDEANDTVGIAD